MESSRSESEEIDKFMIYYSEKLKLNIDLDLIFKALQEGYKVSNGFNGFFLHKEQNCICYNSYGSSATSNTIEGLKFIIERLDENFDLTTFKIGKNLYVNMI